MNVYEKPFAEIISFESESVMYDEGSITPGFSSVSEGVADLPGL